MATMKMPCAVGSGGANTFTYVDINIAGNAQFQIPTTQKAKGLIISYVYQGAVTTIYADDTMTYPDFNNSQITAFPLTFTDNYIDFGREFDPLTYNFKGYYWY